MKIDGGVEDPYQVPTDAICHQRTLVSPWPRFLVFPELQLHGDVPSSESNNGHKDDGWLRDPDRRLDQ